MIWMVKYLLKDQISRTASCLQNYLQAFITMKRNNGQKYMLVLNQIGTGNGLSFHNLYNKDMTNF